MSDEMQSIRDTIARAAVTSDQTARTIRVMTDCLEGIHIGRKEPYVPVGVQQLQDLEGVCTLLVDMLTAQSQELDQLEVDVGRTIQSGLSAL